MTWKSYAAVSGATVLAGWLAASPPSNAPVGAAADVASGDVGDDTGPSDIELEAARLGSRVREEIDFQRPARNPFRFNGARSSGTASVTPPTEVRAPVAVVPIAPPFKLSGIAEDQVGGRTERRAILSSLGEVLIVSEGDQVLGLYRVGAVEAEAVELIRLGDGTSIRLSLRTPDPQ